MGAKMSNNLGRTALGSRLMLMAILSVGVTACGSAPTVGDQIVAQGKGTAAIGTKWNQGSQMVASGQALGNKGRQQIKDGQKMIVDGDNMVSRGKAMMAEAELQYKGTQAHPQTVAIPASPH
jgi:hypothetical protein